MLYINYTQNILGFQRILVKKSLLLTVLLSLIFTEFLIFSLTEAKYFVSDMQQQYTDITFAFFKNGTQVIDRYHFIRQMVWAFDKVRKRIQQIYGKKYRLLFKHSKRLLIKRNVKLKDWKKERSNSLLYISDEMLQAYYLKEQFYKIMDANDRQTAKQLMSDWISSAESCNIEEYKYCAKTLLNWQTEILNSFDVRLFKQFYQRL